MKHIYFLLIVMLGINCSKPVVYDLPTWTPYNESDEIAANADHEIRRMQYKLIQSKHLDKNEVWGAVTDELIYFPSERYDELKPLILEQDMTSMQKSIQDGKFSYEDLTLWYLHRIVELETNPETTLHSIISLNPDAVKIARQRDREKSKNDHPIYGMPILLKDNINTSSMRTTAGALALQKNQTGDAFIVQRLKEKGAIILGKANLSEWAYYFCGGCPVGYSAVGGQTLNPYGRRVFETGGSSSGSGTSMAANYAAAAIGTETSGSILSPSGKNSIVGLKPTIGLLSRSGIVPISSTLDTPGPMTRSISDNAILLSAIIGKDPDDGATRGIPEYPNYLDDMQASEFNSLRLGINKVFLERDSLYRLMVAKIKEAGAQVIEFDPPEISLEGFSTLLNLDMKTDLPAYLLDVDGDSVSVSSVLDIVNFNLEDTTLRMPYGQARLEGILSDTTSESAFLALKSTLQEKGRSYFEVMDSANLDAVLSINNWNAGTAAVAKYPCLGVPMGYKENGEPMNLTFIGKPYSELKLLQIGKAFENLTKARKIPEGYE